MLFQTVTLARDGVRVSPLEPGYAVIISTSEVQGKDVVYI